MNLCSCKGCWANQFWLLYLLFPWAALAPIKKLWCKGCGFGAKALYCEVEAGSRIQTYGSGSSLKWCIRKTFKFFNFDKLEPRVLRVIRAAAVAVDMWRLRNLVLKMTSNPSNQCLWQYISIFVTLIRVLSRLFFRASSVPVPWL